MRFVSGSAVQSQPNVTPMIDVMLVLLIIFMVVTPALINGVALEPPQAVNLTAHPDEDGDQTLGITASGEYYLNKQRIAASGLLPALRAIYAGRDTNRVLYIRADKSVDYSKVIDAMDVAAKSGVVMVGMISDRKPEPKSAVTRRP
jgi:biopolymer transport protein TolR